LDETIHGCIFGHFPGGYKVQADFFFYTQFIFFFNIFIRKTAELFGWKSAWILKLST